MDKLKEVTSYLYKHLSNIPVKLEGFGDIDDPENVEVILSAIANVLCSSTRAVGVTREILIENIMDIWDQGEAVNKSSGVLN